MFTDYTRELSKSHKLDVIYLFHHVQITLEDRIEDKYTSIQSYRLNVQGICQLQCA